MLWEPAVPVPQAFGRPCSLLPISGPLHMLTSLSLWRILALLTPLAMTEVSYSPGRPSLGRPYRVCPCSSEGLSQLIICRNHLSITVIFLYGNANKLQQALCVIQSLSHRESPGNARSPANINNIGWSTSVAGKVLALQGQGPEFEPLEHTLKKKTIRTWWYVFVIPVLGRESQVQAGCWLASLTYLASSSSYLKKQGG